MTRIQELKAAATLRDALYTARDYFVSEEPENAESIHIEYSRYLDSLEEIMSATRTTV